VGPNSFTRKANIVSVFARPGIPGYIFLEGSLSEVTRAVQDLATVFHNLPPRLLPMEQRIALLSPHNPLSRPIEEGQWVRCSHGLYRHDIGFVCGHDPFRDAETTVAFVPRIPDKALRSQDRKTEEGGSTRAEELVRTAARGILGSSAGPKGLTR
jgi:hypothetical protein